MTTAAIPIDHAKFYRIRMRALGWFVALYTSERINSYIADVGPFATIAEAATSGDSTGLPDADKINTPTGRALG